VSPTPGGAVAAGEGQGPGSSPTGLLTVGTLLLMAAGFGTVLVWRGARRS
jgi:hypothetical protein